jgi:hypothetical protein
VSGAVDLLGVDVLGTDVALRAPPVRPRRRGRGSGDDFLSPRAIGSSSPRIALAVLDADVLSLRARGRHRPGAPIPSTWAASTSTPVAPSTGSTPTSYAPV